MCLYSYFFSTSWMVKVTITAESACTCKEIFANRHLANFLRYANKKTLYLIKNLKISYDMHSVISKFKIII